MKDKYTVILLYPDYVASAYGHEYYITWISTDEGSLAAAQQAQFEAVENNGLDESTQADFLVVTVFPGHLPTLYTEIANS